MRKNENAKTRMVVRERERESKRVKNSCSLFDAQKARNIWKNIDKKCNIKLGYIEMAEAFYGIAEPFVRRKCTQKKLQTWSARKQM